MTVIDNAARMSVPSRSAGALPDGTLAGSASRFTSMIHARGPHSPAQTALVRVVQSLLEGVQAGVRSNDPQVPRCAAASRGYTDGATKTHQGLRNFGHALRSERKAGVDVGHGPSRRRGCAEAKPRGADAAAQLASNRAKWQGQGLDDYRYTLQRGGFIAPDARRPVDITVRDRSVVDARFADSGEPLPATLDFNALSIDDLFGLIDEAIANGAARVEVSYDAISGFPREVYIDYNEMIADEELTLTANNLVAQSNPYLYPSRNVLAVGDRMPTIVEPGQQPVSRDYIILGAAESYPAPVTSITIGAQTTPVTLDNGEYFARGLSLTGTGPLHAYLTLADGSRVPLSISIQYVY